MAAVGWAIVSAGSWVCSNIGAVGATAAGVTIAAPVVATAASAAVAYKYGMTPAIVLSGASSAASTAVSASVGAVVSGGKMTLRGLRYVTNFGSEEDDDED